MRRNAQKGDCQVTHVHPAQVEAAKAALPLTRAVERVADAFRTLGHPSRLRLLVALDGRELCVCDIAAVLGLSMSATSQMLRELRLLGAVEYRAEGKMAFYAVADRFWIDLAESVLEKCGGAELVAGSNNG
ncbi:MAG TPA: metalloregulator ArsR/SmtB family transcription factor [Gemmatales bacterium]|nr:metalloregulator ArsR/SmtB family transcription factor [Gemmatales bacterium]